MLPLRRFCPQRLSLAALVIGSLAPDAAYGPPGHHLDRYAHDWLWGAVFGMLTSVFFISYFFFEVPSNLALHRYGARRWMARIWW